MNKSPGKKIAGTGATGANEGASAVKSNTKIKSIKKTKKVAHDGKTKPVSSTKSNNVPFAEPAKLQTQTRASPVTTSFHSSDQFEGQYPLSCQYIYIFWVVIRTALD